MYPLVGRLDRNRRTLGLVRISIHAPLAGCDGKRGRFGRHGGHFNPRPPCGVRPASRRVASQGRHFNPRTPCGVRPLAQFRIVHQLPISIHAPLAGCDRADGMRQGHRRDFNPRTPCGVRQYMYVLEIAR